MKFLDLFAGIGGFRLGLEQAGHTCVGFVEIDKFARKSYEAIFDTEGEYTEHDINKINTKELLEADIWCFGFPCQDISVAGKQKGFEGNRSSLFFAVTRKLHELEDKKKPSYLLIENVKNLLSINSGWDFASLQIELDSLGYDIEWDVLNSKEVVPQNRERVYIIGHLRGRRTRKVFPIIRQNGETNKADRAIKQVGNISNSKSFGGNPQTGRAYDTNGIAPTLSTMQGGGLEPKILDDQGRTKKRLKPLSISPTLRSQSHGNEPKVINPLKRKTNNGWHFEQEVFDEKGIARALKAGGGSGNIPKLAIPPTLTSAIKMRGGQTPMIANRDNLRIRKLTPRECWRLQGFPDWAFDKAQEVNSNSQLYKQAGNSVTVPVIYEIAKRMNWEEE